MVRTILSFIILVSTINVFAQKDTINQTDANGLRQGYWIKQYENGNKAAEGNFKDGKQVGVFKHYQLDGTTNKAIVEHIAGTDSTLTTYYHENGVLMSKGVYVNQKKEGLWKFYDNREIISSEQNFKNDKPHGKSIVYHFNGKVAKDVDFVNGLQQGPFIEYDPNGSKLIEGTYTDGNFDGLIKFYYSNGVVKNQGVYKHAVKNGKWIYYDNEGKVLVEEVYENGNMKSRVMSEETKQKAIELQEERKRQFENPGEEGGIDE